MAERDTRTLHPAGARVAAQLAGELDDLPEGGSAEGVIIIGSVVEIRYEGDDDTERYLIGSIEERHADHAVMSPGSPLGQALMGHVAGDTVEYEAPGGTLKVDIVSVS